MEQPPAPPSRSLSIDHAILIALALVAVLIVYGAVEIFVSNPSTTFLEGLGLLLAGALAGVAKPSS